MNTDTQTHNTSKILEFRFLWTEELKWFPTSVFEWRDKIGVSGKQLPLHTLHTLLHTHFTAVFSALQMESNITSSELMNDRVKIWKRAKKKMYSCKIIQIIQLASCIYLARNDDLINPFPSRVFKKVSATARVLSFFTKLSWPPEYFVVSISEHIKIKNISFFKCGKVSLKSNNLNKDFYSEKYCLF